MSKFFSRFSRRARFLVTLFVTFFLVLAMVYPQPGGAVSLYELLYRGAQIYQASNISDRQEIAYGAQINQSILKQVKIHPNQELNTYINNIGQQLARNSARTNIPYTFQVVNDNSVNAFATMGGYVYINSGLIKLADNEAQLASVIGHEIGHITGRHSIEQLKQTMIAQGITSLAGLSNSQIGQIGVEIAFSRPRSREMEYDADRRGMENIIRTGYAPAAMPDFMQKLVTASTPPTFLSTHPAPADRVARLQKMIPAGSQSKTAGMDPTPYRQRVNYFLGGSR
jgi:beta-barrel assembly-enhancing protease